MFCRLGTFSEILSLDDFGNNKNITRKEFMLACQCFNVCTRKSESFSVQKLPEKKTLPKMQIEFFGETPFIYNNE